MHAVPVPLGASYHPVPNGTVKIRSRSSTLQRLSAVLRTPCARTLLQVVGFPIHHFCKEVLALIEEGKIKL